MHPVYTPLDEHGIEFEDGPLGKEIPLPYALLAVPFDSSRVDRGLFGNLLWQWKKSIISVAVL